MAKKPKPQPKPPVPAAPAPPPTPVASAPIKQAAAPTQKRSMASFLGFLFKRAKQKKLGSSNTKKKLGGGPKLYN